MPKFNNISLEEFKSIVINDFRNAAIGAETLRQVISENECRHITHNCDVAQAVLAKFLRNNDLQISAGIDLTFQLALQRTSPTQFFSEFYSSNQHIYASSCTEFLPVAVGAAMAEKMYRNDNALQHNTPAENLILCTLSGEIAADGDFLESLYSAAIQRLPLAIVLWNNNGEHTNGSFLKLLSGFAAIRKNGSSLSIQAVKGNDYSALCHTFEQQINLARNGKMTTLTFVEGDDDELSLFSQWIVSKQIADASQLHDIQQQVRHDAERERKDAYYKSLVNDTPIRPTLRSTKDLAQLAHAAHPNAIFIGDMPNAINKAIGLAQCGLRPIVEAKISIIEASLLASRTELPIVVRTTEMDFGALLFALPKTIIAVPCCKLQADELYKSIIAQDLQTIVVEQVGTGQVGCHHDFELGVVHKETNGTDATILCCGAAVEPTIDAAAMLQQKNISVEVIDLCTLRPLDNSNVVAESISKSRRLFIVDTDRAQAVARYILAELSLRGDAMKNLIIAPKIVVPQKDRVFIEAVDVLRGVERIFQ